MNTDSDNFILNRVKSQTRYFGVMSAILLGITLLVPIVIVRLCAMLGLVLAGWQFIFHGLTVISLQLEDTDRQRFQIVISVVVPILLSLYFIQNVETLTIKAMIGHMVTPSYLIPTGIIAYVSWLAGDYLDADHPFRGFLIACAVIFVICGVGHHGIYFEYDDYSGAYTSFIDNEAAGEAVENGRYFGQFLVYVTISYGAMFLRRRRTLV